MDNEDFVPKKDDQFKTDKNGNKMMMSMDDSEYDYDEECSIGDELGQKIILIFNKFKQSKFEKLKI